MCPENKTCLIICIPVDTRRKLNVHKTSRTSSERLMYVQFTSCVHRNCILAQVVQSRYQLIEYQPRKMFIIDDSLQYLENLGVGKKKALLSGIVESIGVTYVGQKRYSINTLVQAFEYTVLS